MDSFGCEAKRPILPIGHLRRRPLVSPQTGFAGFGPVGQSFIHGRGVVQTHNHGKSGEGSSNGILNGVESLFLGDSGSLGLVNLSLSLERELNSEETYPKESEAPANNPCWVKPDPCQSCERLGDYWKILLSKVEQARMMSLYLEQRRMIQANYGMNQFHALKRTSGMYSPKQRPPTGGSDTSYVSIEECYFCKSQGQEKAMYRSHSMRSPCTKEIICPLLTANMCLICGDNGGFDVHTVKDCTNQLRAPGNGRF